MAVNLTDFIKHSQTHIALLNRFIWQLRLIKNLLNNQNDRDGLVGLDDLLAQKDELHARLNESFSWQEQLQQNLDDTATTSPELQTIKHEIESLATTIYDEATLLATLFKQTAQHKQSLLAKTTIKINLPKNPYGKNHSSIIDIEA